MTEQTLTEPIDERQELSRGFSRYQSILVALLALVQFTIIIDFMIMSPLGAIIMPALNISAAQFGVAGSAPCSPPRSSHKMPTVRSGISTGWDTSSLQRR